MSKVFSTRSSSEIYGFGSGVTGVDKCVTCCKLPTYHQVLHSFLAYYSEEERKNTAVAKQNAARATFHQAKIHFEQADIPMQEGKNCIRLIKTYHEKFKRDIASTAVSRRNKPFALERVNNFDDLLNKTIFGPQTLNKSCLVELDQSVKMN